MARLRRSNRCRTWVPVLVCAFGAALVMKAALASASPSAAPLASAQRIASSFPGGRYFNITCGFSHRNNDDPIVFPGAPGKSHNHTYIGNRSVNAATTPDALVDGASTCSDLDSSTYWVPTLYEGLEPLPPLGAIVYYTRHTSEPITTVPAGLKMVAGNASARRAQPKGIVSWSCGGGSGKRFSAVPRCAESSALAFNIRFPNCWNGRATDSADHKRHMAYSTAGACPDSHPVRLPTIALVLLYEPTSPHAELSSGKLGLHGDFMNGWDQQVLGRLVAGLNG